MKRGQVPRHRGRLPDEPKNEIADPFQLMVRLLELSEPKDHGDEILSIGVFEAAMGRDEATRRGRMDLVERDPAIDVEVSDPLEGLTRAQLGRILGGAEAARRFRPETAPSSPTTSAKAPALSQEDFGDYGARLSKTGVFAAKLCRELVHACATFAAGNVEAARAMRMNIARKWNAFADQNFWGEGRRLDAHKLCARCGRPLILTAPNRKLPPGPKAAPELHGWCRGNEKSSKKKAQRRAASKTVPGAQRK